jgi:hypothetical protein
MLVARNRKMTRKVMEASHAREMNFSHISAVRSAQQSGFHVAAILRYTGGVRR